MDCPHDQGLGAHWDYVSADGTSANGWIVCLICGGYLERLTIAGGWIRSRGHFAETFKEQASRSGVFSDLQKLEIG